MRAVWSEHISKCVHVYLRPPSSFCCCCGPSGILCAGVDDVQWQHSAAYTEDWLVGVPADSAWLMLCRQGSVGGAGGSWG